MSDTLAPSVTHRDRKGRKFMDLVGQAYDSVGLSEEEAQRVNDTSGLPDLIRDFITNNRRSSQFANEEVSSSYTYPQGYKARGIAEQVAALREFFLELKNATYDETIATRLLPAGAEGWFAIPRWERLGSSYGEAVDKVLATIKSERTFYNYREGQTGSEYLRQHAKTVKAFQKLGDEQKGHDILIVPCQFGLRHRGRSIRRAREVMNAVEFGLGAFVVGCMILTHPEREVRWEQLHIDCAGDEFFPGADGEFSHAPYFLFLGDEVGFDTFWTGSTCERYGSASGFLPQ